MEVRGVGLFRLRFPRGVGLRFCWGVGVVATCMPALVDGRGWGEGLQCYLLHRHLSLALFLPLSPPHEVHS